MATFVNGVNPCSKEWEPSLTAGQAIKFENETCHIPIKVENNSSERSFEQSVIIVDNNGDISLECSKEWEPSLTAGQVIKSENETCHIPIKVENNSSERSFEQSVIIVDNNGDISLECMNPSLLKCVKEVLEDVERQHSLPAGQFEGSEVGSEQQTTYIIDLSTFEEPRVLQQRCSSDDNKIRAEKNIQEISFISSLSENSLANSSKDSDSRDGLQIISSVSTQDDNIADNSQSSYKIETLPPTGDQPYLPQQSSNTNMTGVTLRSSATAEGNAPADSVTKVFVTSPEHVQETIHDIPYSSTVLLPSNESLSENRDKGSMLSAQPLELKASGICSDSSCDSFPSSTSSIPDAMVYKCTECDYSSHNKHYYKQHVDLVHREDRPYKCPHCDYAGKRRHALLEHMVVHSNQRPFTCDHCNASFRKKGHLTNHIKLHTSQRLVHCGVCNIQLPDSEAFQVHLQKIHNTDKLFKCKLCDHTVIDREVMLRHLQTHNEAIVYSCPNCKCVLDSEESLIAHMMNVHNFHLVKGSQIKQNPASKINESSVQINSEAQVPMKPVAANIMCSECGFVGSNNEVMQGHMWSHINKNNSKPEVQTATSAGPSLTSTLGVLKMNVDLGQKTLPKDVVYQCTSCTYTSSDNSAFIKHMLAHKTQDKRQRIISADRSRPGDPDREAVPVSKLLARSVAYPAKPDSQGQKQAESSVPFIYDKDAARYRCIICGYHCEFQRTIKAHIWKHSGHQNIEYPTFDQVSTSKSKPASSLMQDFANRAVDDFVRVAPRVGILSNMPTNSVQHVSALPGSALKLKHISRHNQGEVMQIKDVSDVPPLDVKMSMASRLLENIVNSSIKLEIQSTKQALEPNSSSSILCSRESSQTHCVSAVEVRQAVTDVREPVVTKESALISIVKSEMYEQGESMSSTDEGCTEPSVVVEVMDTVSSESGLTGLASQHGSPRILDLDGSGGEVKLIKAFETEEKLWRKSLLQNETDSTFIAKAHEGSTSDLNRNHHSYSVRLRCPICDKQIQEDFKNHLLACQKKIDTQPLKVENRLLMSTEVDRSHNEDTDSTESSDELSASGGFSQQQKSGTGICSSLLAVIEQLRERSRSESEEERLGDGSMKKNKKKGHLADSDLESIDELQNIEKIVESGGEKYRCSLCHYTSQRICNIKLHMKTHRQKKPSECSLCDFSSTTPEALQEHMLKHCKVRTYACKFCPQSFNHKSTLRAHLRAHKDQEPFLCAYCVFETTNPMEYREHMLVHSGCSSRLRCPGCELILNNKEELTVHLLKCKGGAKRGRPLCDTTERSAVEKDAEKIDASSVTHACVVSGCSYMSTSLVKLQDHLSVHCNPSLLVCNLCDFKALHSRSLKSHMKRHSNDQRYVQQPLEQYKCNLCGYVCHHLPSLKSHMWRHASDQSYSYEFTNDVINAAIDHDTRVEADGEPDDPELLDRVINSERRILEGELNKSKKGDGQRAICWVTFRCCSCGFETINKAKLNIHMRAHSDIIQQALDLQRKSQPPHKYAAKRRLLTDSAASQLKVARMSDLV